MFFNDVVRACLGYGGAKGVAQSPKASKNEMIFSDLCEFGRFGRGGTSALVPALADALGKTRVF